MNGMKKMVVFALFGLILIAISANQATFAGTNKITPELRDKFKISNNNLIPVIVQTNQGLQDRHKKLITQEGGNLKHNLTITKSFAATLSPKTIDKLANYEDVTKIVYDSEVQICLDQATSTIGTSKFWDNGNFGQGVTVAVLDTGVYPHPDLIQPQNRIVAFKDIVSNRKQPYDDHGHGTHVAGIIAGNGLKSNGIYRGVAPEANIVGIKVLDSTGNGRVSDVVSGLQWALNNKDLFGIKIINLSMAAIATQSYYYDPLCQAVERAWDNGVVVVTAAGNNGPSQGTIGSPGIDPKIITVGATNDLGTSNIADDIIPIFSSRGPTIDGFAKPDLVAPGVLITSLATSLQKNGSSLTAFHGIAPQASIQSKSVQITTNFYNTMTGSSMATPLVSGLAALLLESNATYSPVEIKTLLIKNAVPLGFSTYDEGYGELHYQNIGG